MKCQKRGVRPWKLINDAVCAKRGFRLIQSEKGTGKSFFSMEAWQTDK